MELTYPINLVDFDDAPSSGDVLTRHGEYLGSWTFIKDDNGLSGVLYFVADGENEPMFSEKIGFLESGLLKGMAMSFLCSSIREWHEKLD